MGLFLIGKANYKHKTKLLLSIFFLFISLVILTPQNTYAVTRITNMTPNDSATAFVYYKALRTCLTEGRLKNWGGTVNPNSMSAQEAQNYSWFYDLTGIIELVNPNNTNVGVYGDPRNEGDGQYSCYGDQGKQFLKSLVQITGYSGGPEFLCAIGFTRDKDAGGCSTVVQGAENDFIAPGDKGGSLDRWWFDTIEATDDNASGIGPGQYVLYYESFLKACKPLESSSGDIKIMAPGTGDKLIEKTYTYADRNIGNSYTFNLYSGTRVSCEDMVNRLQSDENSVRQFNAWLAASDENRYENEGGGTGSAVDDGSSDTSCVIDGVGWFVCSVAIFIAEVTDGIYGLIENLLRVPVVNIDTSSGTNGVYNAWSAMRSIANVAFVIAFLIIIFSQLTSMGVSNYGIKKTLPRLVVAAILVNVSFWVSAILVDLSNIIGAGIYDVLTSIRDQMNIGISGNGNWLAIISALLAGVPIVATAGAVTAAVGVGVAAAGSSVLGPLLFLAIPLVLAAVLSVFVAIFVLIARQALVTILIIVSPLAFVALLLPNTEKLFTRWRQTLVSLLLLYPIVSLIFAGAQIAGLAILASAALPSDIPLTQADVTRVGVAILVGQLVMVIPFFFIPSIITKFSGGNLDSFAANIKKRGAGLIGGASGAARAFGRKSLNRGFNRLKYGAESDPNGLTRRGRIRRLVRGGAREFDQYNDRNDMTDSTLKTARATATRERLATDSNFATAAAAGDVARGTRMQDRAVAAAEAEELKEALEPLVREIAKVKATGGNTDDFLKIRAKDTSRTEGERSAALHELSRLGRDDAIRDLDSHFATSTNPADTNMRLRLQGAVQANAGALIGKAPDLVKGAGAAFNGINGNDLASFSKGTAKQYMQYLESLRMTGSPDYPAAAASFKRAIEDIATTPALQGGFKVEVGAELLNGLNPYIENDISPAIAARIQPDGKIR